jgi:hypothetical protein
MKALRLALATGALAAAGLPLTAQSDPHAAPDVGAATLAYLGAVGRIRAQVNSDNRERIPALILGGDAAALAKEETRIVQFKRDVAGLPTENVDSDAVQFADNFGAILAAYAAVCSDSSELFREAARADRQPDSRHLVAGIKRELNTAMTDAIGAAGALAEACDRLAASAQPARLTIEPIVGKVRDDRDTLVAAKDAHREFTKKVKDDLPQRYPSIDWTPKEILPP